MVPPTRAPGWTGRREASTSESAYHGAGGMRRRRPPRGHDHEPGRDRTIRARAVLVATGTRERPRPAPPVPGDAPRGRAHHRRAAAARRQPGARRPAAVVVGAEHVSFSAVLTLRHAGCEVVAMVTGSADTRATPPCASRAREGGSPCSPAPRSPRSWGAGASRPSSSPTSAPPRPAACRATRWCSPATGSPITSWRARAGSSSTPAPRHPGRHRLSHVGARGVRRRQPPPRRRDRRRLRA